MDLRRFITSITFLLSFVFAYAQNGKIKGIVQYKYNDYIGYKIDVGAEVYAVSKQNAGDFNLTKWNDYEKTVKTFIEYAEYLDEPIEGLSSLDLYCKRQYEKISERFEEIALVDNSGKYELSLPYGEYYIFVKSKNRNRSFSLTDSEVLILVKEINLSKPLLILSFDVDF